MRFVYVLLVLLLITPLAARAATSTLALPESPSTEGEPVLINWHPAAGTYRIVVEQINENGEVVSSESAGFTVDPIPPPPSPEVQGTSTVESSEKIQETIAHIIPQASAAAPVFSTIDGLRQKSVEVLGAGEAWAKKKVGTGEVAGESTKSSGIATVATQLVATLLLYLFAILKFLVSNAGIFYPVFAALFFYLLWRLFKRTRRPRYR